MTCQATVVFYAWAVFFKKFPFVSGDSVLFWNRSFKLYTQASTALMTVISHSPVSVCVHEQIEGAKGKPVVLENKPPSVWTRINIYFLLLFHPLRQKKKKREINAWVNISKPIPKVQACSPLPPPAVGEFGRKAIRSGEVKLTHGVVQLLSPNSPSFLCNCFAVIDRRKIHLKS